MLKHQLHNATGSSPVHYSIASSPSGGGDDDDADEAADDEAPTTSLEALGGSIFGDVPKSAWRRYRKRTKQGSRLADPSGPSPTPGAGGGSSRSRVSPSTTRPTPYGASQKPLTGTG